MINDIMVTMHETSKLKRELKGMIELQRVHLGCAVQLQQYVTCRIYTVLMACQHIFMRNLICASMCYWCCMW